jgi:ferrous iron transport protein A
MPNPPILLTELATDEEGAVVELRGGSRFLARLATLGFTPGARLTMIQNFGHGPLIVSVRDTRIALGRGEANKVIVRRRVRYGTP